jgi:hypothetical protein
LSRGKRNPRSRSKASSSGCIDSMGRIVGRIRSERAHVACHHGVVARRRLYRRMIFLPTPRRFATVRTTKPTCDENPSSHARLMTVVVSPRLQSFMERRQCYMVRDYIHIVPVKSHNTLEVDRKPSHQSLTDLKSNGPSLRADTAKAVVHRTTLRSQGARSARTLDPTRAWKEAPSGRTRAHLARRRIAPLHSCARASSMSPTCSRRARSRW